jgi:drug/metabolite transporter (DMT)-like permease
MVGLEAALPRGKRLHLPTLAGILVGMAGVLILFVPGTADTSIDSASLLKGFLVLQFGAFCWCLGMALHRRLTTNVHPVVSGAVQQFATGLAYMPAAIFVNEQPVKWSERGVLALCWLVIFGSVVAYSAFIYAMEHLSVAIMSTYPYVNPVVAVVLGWLFYREPFGWRETVAMLAVFTGVALVKYYSSREPRPLTEPANA